jgi:hypothetical protein
MNEAFFERIQAAVSKFVAWLERYGEDSHDHQSFYASKIGRRSKALYYRKPMLGTLAVAPMELCEAFLPSARRLFWTPQRFPIADAHYAMGFALLAQACESDAYYRRAVHFLEVLQRTRCPGYERYCWGYPFDWETKAGTIKQGTPLITTVPYAYEAFSYVYAIDRNQKWLEVMRSIAEHAAYDYREWEIGPNTTSTAYCPGEQDRKGVINANAYRAFLLLEASHDFCQERYKQIALRNLNFVLESQNADGSWYYARDPRSHFVDHFHTCFVLKALGKIEPHVGDKRLREAIDRGVDYYVQELFDAEGLPIPFSRAPRLTVYRRELYDYAECVNLAVLLRGRFNQLDLVLSRVIADLLARWQKRDGSFRSRKLLIGWDKVPMHRWAQSQLFRSLSFLLYRNANPAQGSLAYHSVPALEQMAN